MNQVQNITLIQSHFEDSNLELDLSKNVNGHYTNEVTRYAWMNWMTAYSFWREHQANFINKAKPLKQVSWSSVPVGVAVQTVNHKFICTFVGMTPNGLISIYNKTVGADNYRAAKFELAPASEQDWIAVQDGETGYGAAQVLRSKGLEVKMHQSHEKYRITGLAEGYELK